MTQQQPDWPGAPGEQQSFGPRFTSRIHFLESVFRERRPALALDIGCGRGAVTRVLARWAERVVATEITDEAVRVARESLEDVANVEVHLFDVFAPADPESPFAGGRFDLVLLSEVLEHIEDDVGALRRIREMLDRSGVLVLTVPRDPALWTLEDDLWSHKRRYLRDDLTAKLESTGFRTRSVWTWGFPVTGYFVRLQTWRLERGSKGQREGALGAALALPRSLLPLARALFTVVAAFERTFKSWERGLGYVVVAEPDRSLR